MLRFGFPSAESTFVTVNSPNTSLKPLTATSGPQGQLMLGGLDVIQLAETFGSPLWLLDEKTIVESVRAAKAGLAGYPEAGILYAGKAFLCLAMCKLIAKLGLGLDVVSQGELHTALAAGFNPELIYMHGNNKSEAEILYGLGMGDVKIVVDNLSELELVAALAEGLGKRVKVLFRITPGVEPDTHQYIKTGQQDSKFGLAPEHLPKAMAFALAHAHALEPVGLHAHIGSQSHDIGPYLQIVQIMADLAKMLKQVFDLDLEQLDLGGGLGICYAESDRPIPIYEWAKAISTKVMETFPRLGLHLPKLLIEPGRAIVGTSGVTIYRCGHEKLLPDGKRYLALDGGMADNPRPVMYQARYSAERVNPSESTGQPSLVTLVGKFCESGDIIIKDAYLNAKTGDYIAVFGTGAYNYSMASNYNRTPRPACLLLADGQAEVIIERETLGDLLSHDRIPKRLAATQENQMV